MLLFTRRCPVRCFQDKSIETPGQPYRGIFFTEKDPVKKQLCGRSLLQGLRL